MKSMILCVNVYHYTSETGGYSIKDSVFYCYYHALSFWGGNVGAYVILEIRSEGIELESGEYHVEFETMSNDYNAVQKQIQLYDDYVNYSYRPNPTVKKMNLSYTKKGVDVFEIELKYVDGEGDFLVKWEGLVKDK